MSELVRCPDCGGIVGATETTDEGAPCTCFHTARHDPDGGGVDGGGLSGTAVMQQQAPVKVCCICGKDLTGQKRLKDSRGYWCPECHAEDRASKEPQGVKCERCKRKVPEQSLTSVDGQRVCTRCLREERELRAPGNKKYRPISDNTYKEAEKKKIMIMVAVLIVLAILMAISWPHRPWKDSRGHEWEGQGQDSIVLISVDPAHLA